MTSLTVIDREGSEREIAFAPGVTIMEAIRDAGIDELLALCGGSCSCATCHVYVEAASETLPPMQEDEDDLLESSSHRRPSSRLSCQLAARTSIVVRIAPED